MVCLTWELPVTGITVVFPKIFTRLINFFSMTLNLESGVLCGLKHAEGAYY